MRHGNVCLPLLGDRPYNALPYLPVRVLYSFHHMDAPSDNVSAMQPPVLMRVLRDSLVYDVRLHYRHDNRDDHEPCGKDSYQRIDVPSHSVFFLHFAR